MSYLILSFGYCGWYASDAIAQLSPSPTIYKKDGLDIFEKAEKDHTYVIIADTAKGVGEDYSAFTIVDVTSMPYKQVGKYRDNTISPLLYPSIIYKVGKEYNEAYVLVEVNTSEQVADILYGEYEYENIIFVNRTTQGQVVSGGFGGGKSQLGVVTDKKVKRIGCSNFKSMVEEKKLLIRDADTISEISTFIQRKNSYGAEYYHSEMCPHPNKDLGKAIGRYMVLSTFQNNKTLLPNDRVHLLGTASPIEFGMYKHISCIESIDTSNPIMAAIGEMPYTKMGLHMKPIANMNKYQDV